MENKNIKELHTMKAIEYFIKNKIIWGYIHLDKGFPYFKFDGEWHPYIAHYDPTKFKKKKFRDKYKSKDYYIKNVVIKSQYYKTDYITYETSNINSIDIDCDKIKCDKFKKKYDFLLSKGRRLPHFFCKIVNTKKLHMGLYRTGVGKIDVLTGQASYCKANEVVFIKGGIRHIDIREIYKLVGKKIPKKNDQECVFISSDDEEEIIIREKPNIEESVIYNLFSSLNASRYEDFESWFKIVSFLKFFHDYEKGLLISSMLSKKSTKIEHKMNISKFAELYEKIPTNKPCSINTFLIWLKDDNPKKYKIISNKIYPKNNIDVEYENIKEEFELTHFHVEGTNNFYKKLGDTYYCYNTSNFRDVVAEYDYQKICNNGNTKEVIFFNKWIKDKTRKKFYGVDWIPKKINDPKIFNEFTGFNFDTDYDNFDFESVNIFLKHIEYICDSNIECYKYFKNYIAHMFQTPDKLPGISILIKSIEGCGKDLLIDILEKILGSSCVHRTSDLSNIFGNYNSCLKKKLILQLNEVQGGEGYKVKEQLKDIITRDKHPIQAKYCALTNYSNFLRVFIFSNNRNPIHINDNDRRFFVLRIPNKKNREYYTRLASILDDDNALKSILSYFMSQDISEFNIREIPMTKEKKIMRSHNRDYLYDFLLENYEFKTGKEFISGYSILHSYNDFLLNNNYQNKINNRQLKCALSYIEGIKYKRKDNIRGYYIDYDKLKKYLINFIDTSEEE